MVHVKSRWQQMMKKIRCVGEWKETLEMGKSFCNVMNHLTIKWIHFERKNVQFELSWIKSEALTPITMIGPEIRQLHGKGNAYHEERDSQLHKEETQPITKIDTWRVNCTERDAYLEVYQERIFVFFTEINQHFTLLQILITLKAQLSLVRNCAVTRTWIPNYQTRVYAYLCTNLVSLVRC